MPRAGKQDGSDGRKPRDKRGGRRMPEEQLTEIFAEVREKLDSGLSAAAEELLVDALGNYSHSPDDEARLTRYLSYTLETLGRYKESLAVIDRYDTDGRRYYVAIANPPGGVPARQLTDAFTGAEFDGFPRASVPDVHFVTMTRYRDDLKCPAAFAPQNLKGIFPEVVAKNGPFKLFSSDRSATGIGINGATPSSSSSGSWSPLPGTESLSSWSDVATSA